MRATVGEKPVEDQAEDREEEDDDAPEQLVRGRAVGLEDFHYRSLVSSIFA
jgi:hypothetical protein